MELAPYLREMFSDEDLEQMGIWALVLMHKPVAASDGDLRVLSVDRRGGGRWLDAYFGRHCLRWRREIGFLFFLPASSE